MTVRTAVLGMILSLTLQAATVSQVQSFTVRRPTAASGARISVRSPADNFARQHQSRRNDRTRLHLLLEVPDGFFTFTFPCLGLFLSISKNFARARMEERAWEQRLEEGREALLERDPTLTELDVRRREAANEWSAYGMPRMEQEQEVRGEERGRGARVRVVDRELDQDNYREKSGNAAFMSDVEIEAFEREYGVTYDPYYDDPYTVEELPEGKFNVDKLYGDRIYGNGEIFYKDGATELYYRQGSKPRNLSFFG